MRRILCRFCVTFLNFSGYSWVIRILSPPLWGVARNRNPSQASAKQGFFFRLWGCGSRPHPCVHSLQRIAAIFHPPALPHQIACLCSSVIGHRSSRYSRRATFGELPIQSVSSRVMNCSLSLIPVAAAFTPSCRITRCGGPSRRLPSGTSASR